MMKNPSTRIVLALALALSVAACATAPAAPSATSTFDLQGHRGARGLAPENTLPGFERAMAVGVTTLELDIGITLDERVVVAHDPYLNPLLVRDAGGRYLPGPRGPLLNSVSFRQLTVYDVGRIQPGSSYAQTFATQTPADRARIPSLSEVFYLVKGKRAEVRFNIETKINPTQPAETVSPEIMTQRLLEVVRDHGMTSRVSIQSFDWRTLQLVQKLEPSIPTVYLTVQTANNDNVRDGAWTAGFKLADHGSVPRLVKAAGGKTWSPNAGAVTEPLVKEAQALGLKVIPWTVNNPADMDRLIGWGVDGLITDYPDRLRDVMQKRGMPLPPQRP